MSDLQTRRAIVEGIDAEGHFQKVVAKVPLAEMDGYSSSLRSLSQGRPNSGAALMNMPRTLRLAA
jgi:elongation factor G